MQGFIHRKVPMWVRRLATITAFLIVIGLGLDPTRTLVLSQVVLSFALAFAIIPLTIFTSRRAIMGVLVNHKITTIAAWLVAGVIVVLNLLLLYQTFFPELNYLFKNILVLFGWLRSSQTSLAPAAFLAKTAQIADYAFAYH